MSHRAQAVPSRRYVALVVVLAIGGFLGGVLSVQWAVGECTSAFLEAAGRLEAEAFYTGDARDPLLGVGAYWTLALAYAAPVLLSASCATMGDRPSRRGARTVTYAVFGFTVLFLLGTVSFAFDPSRVGNHRPLVDRYEEFSYAASDLVMAATWTMLVTAALAVSTIELERRRTRIVLTAVAFVASGCLFAVTFS